MASNSHTLMLIIALLSLAGCGETEVQAVASAPTADFVAIPSHLDFGEVGQGVATTLAASLQNVGDLGGEIVSVSSSSDQLTTDLTPGTALPANGFIGFSVGWLPGAGGALNDTLTVRVANSSGEEASVLLPVSGNATGPLLSVKIDTLDVGTIGVGCNASAWLTVENLGNDVRRVENISLTADPEFELTAIDGAPLALPLALAPGDVATARLNYAPTTEASQKAHLVLTTNDVYTPTVELDIDGRGTMEWMTQDEEVQEQAIAAVVVANDVLLSIYGDEFERALPVFFETLLARQVPFRIAFTMSVGDIVGDVPYLDETVLAADAPSAVLAMLGEPLGNDNDQILFSLVEAVRYNRSWLLDESAVWAASQLNLVGINNDTEQSGGNAEVYVNQLASYTAAGTEMVTVHAIAGDEPMGCEYAEPAGQLFAATVLTGGTFGSICDRDWEASMVALAEGMPGSNAYLFGLDETPVEGSVTVSVGHVPVESGWTYSGERNTVIFEEGSRPEMGSTVTLEYAKVCEGK